MESLLNWQTVEGLSKNIWKVLRTVKELSACHGAGMFFEQAGCFCVFVDFRLLWGFCP